MTTSVSAQQTQENALGSRIRLLSSSLIRYEGTLHKIDPAENTVSLTQVRIYGTEGRKNGHDEVPASDMLFDFIVFRGSDIKDLAVYHNESTLSVLDPAVVSATPAAHQPAPPVSVAAQGGNDATKSFPTAARGGFYDRPTTVSPGQGQQQQQRGGGNNNNRRNYQSGGGGNQRGGDGHNNNAGGGGGRYHGGHRNYHRGGYGGGGGRGGNAGGHYRRRQEGHTGMDFEPATGAQREEFKEEFDFTKSREEFDKKKSDFEKAKEDAKVHAKAYSKSSFFDTISCDQKEKAQGRVDREEMKKADTETFGSEMVGSMRGFRRGRGGRGRYNRY